MCWLGLEEDAFVSNECFIDVPSFRIAEWFDPINRENTRSGQQSKKGLLCGAAEEKVIVFGFAIQPGFGSRMVRVPR